VLVAERAGVNPDDGPRHASATNTSVGRVHPRYLGNNPGAGDRYRARVAPGVRVVWLCQLLYTAERVDIQPWESVQYEFSWGDGTNSGWAEFRNHDGFQKRGARRGRIR